jgi:hypothetical protein
LAVNPLTERVIWTDDQDPISHMERWGFVVIKGSIKGGSHNIHFVEIEISEQRKKRSPSFKSM